MQNKLKEMARLLLECRDALPAINMVDAKLRGIDLTLADRIEECLEPWEIVDNNPYGNCPKCGARGHSRERRPDGNDTCINGCTYKSSEAICNVEGI